MIDHTFKIRIVNVQKVIEVRGSRINSIDNTSLIAMVKRKINQLRERRNLYLSEFQQLFVRITWFQI